MLKMTPKDRGPDKFALFPPLGEQAQTAAVPRKNFQHVAALAPEHKQRTKDGIGSEGLLHLGGDPIHPFAHIAGLGGQMDFHTGSGRDHADAFRFMVDREAADRDHKRLRARLKFATLRQAAGIEDIDMRTPCGIDQALLARLADALLDRLVYNAHRLELIGDSMRRIRCKRSLDAAQSN